MAFTVRISNRVRQFVATLDDRERSDFLRCLNLIQQDPYIDGRYKISFPMPPAVFTLYYDGHFSILYHLASAETIHVFSARRGPYLPPPSEFEKRH